MPSVERSVERSDDGFRGPQVCSIVGITYRQLDYWARTDLLRPSISEAKGSGTQRRYSYRDLVELKVIKRLLDAGVSLQSARRALECLRENLGEDVASASLVLGEGRSVLARTDEEVIDLLRGGQGVLNIMPLAGLMAELDTVMTTLHDRPGRESPAEAPPADLRTGSGG
jgi:DNA-binding transcriptional MerR regulator